MPGRRAERGALALHAEGNSDKPQFVDSRMIALLDHSDGLRLRMGRNLGEILDRCRGHSGGLEQTEPLA